MADSIPSATGQYLTFCLAGEYFAAEVSRVREVLEVAEITHVPQSPEYMLGIINLRGTVVPVIDLRSRFGIPKKEFTKNTCIIVVEAMEKAELVISGLLVDSVQEVVSIDEINQTPRIGMNRLAGFLSGVARIGEHFTLVLELEKLFSEENFGDLPISGPAPVTG
jgi:methyl-accepting chemotaxis protein/purine-binding chemotaxis protein CheW